MGLLEKFLLSSLMVATILIYANAASVEEALLKQEINIEKENRLFNAEAQQIIINKQDFESLMNSSETKITWINSTHLLELITYLVEQRRTGENDVIVIDTRSSDEYNGWNFNTPNNNDLTEKTLNSLYENTNGHISFAHNLNSEWLELFNNTMLNDFIIHRYGFKLQNQTANFGDKTKERIVPVILYDTDRQRLEKVKTYLNNNFDLKRIYLCQIDEQDIERFSKKLNETSIFFREPFYDMLIAPGSLNSIIRPVKDQNGNPSTNPLIDYKLFDVSKEELRYHYEIGHIPSAVHLNTDDLEVAPTWTRKNSTELAKTLLSLGIKPNNTDMIILYGNPDPMASFRVAVIMKSIGVKNIHILNGGYQGWFDKFYPIEATINMKASIEKDLEKQIKLFVQQSSDSKSPINYIVDANYVEDLVKNLDLFSDRYALIDIRSYEEFSGEISGYPDLLTKGRIPGAYWGRAGSQPNRLEDYRNPDLTMRSGLEILKMWEDLDIDYKKKHLIFYCGNGWRSSEVMYYAELMGLYRISLYDGGWYDWSTKFGKIDNKNETFIDSNSTVDFNSTIFSNLTINTNVTDFSNTTISPNITIYLNTTVNLNNTINSTTILDFNSTIINKNATESHNSTLFDLTTVYMTSTVYNSGSSLSKAQFSFSFITQLSIIYSLAKI